ncbi:hypothetical protein [Dysgonomonas sp. ZJ279]|uniref:hypothetical protein n=1 Tax=Dysgonomonas sp. ZJ279 TaxID=2709796 RepID=UPI0013EAB174|nr:hypothetical protein [Dysgonomonas sp. ZJ279]
MKETGILIDSELGDLSVKVTRNSSGLITGGLIIGKVEEQNQDFIIYANAGEYKDRPTVGVGVTSMLLSSDALTFKHLIRAQLEADGFRVSYLDIPIDSNNQANIKLNAKY